LSSIGSFSYDCAKWLSDSLSELRHHETCVKDTLKEISVCHLRQLSVCLCDERIASETEIHCKYISISRLKYFSLFCLHLLFVGLFFQSVTISGKIFVFTSMCYFASVNFSTLNG